MASLTKYHPEGKEESMGKTQVYVTGPHTSHKAIILVTDAFGLVPPIIRGADLLASLAHALVIVPDYFNGEPALLSWLNEDGSPAEATKASYMKFVQEKASSPDNLPNVFASVEEARSKWPDVTCWLGLGLGWGGKLIAHASGLGTPFRASGQAYPSKPAREDAEKIVIPHICLASRTDNVEGVRAYAQLLSGKGKVGFVETYDMYHGWMGARSDLTDPDTVKEFERGYSELARFFAQFA